MDEIIEYKGFYIQPTVTGFRISRVDNTEIHSHLKHKSACISIADYISKDKIPKDKGFYYLSCLYNLATNQTYRNKVKSLMDVRCQKGRKLNYHNPSNKKSGGII